MTATDPSGIWDADFYLWRGPDGSDPHDSPDNILPNENTTPADCVASSSTTSTCSKTFTFEPDWWVTNADAGTWKVGVQVSANDDSWAERYAYTTTRLQRHSKLTVNASPEPIAKGKTLTITGKLTRANWDTSWVLLVRAVLIGDRMVAVGRCWPLLSGLGRPRGGPGSGRRPIRWPTS